MGANGYRAVAGRASSGWRVVLEGTEPRVEFDARDLADVEPLALKMLWGHTGEDLDRLDVDVTLPQSVEVRLDMIAHLCGDRDRECDAAIAEMVDLGLSVADIERILREYDRPARALTVTNREIAEHGLDQHPDVVGLSWDDHGFAVTVKCRRHVDATRRSYLEAPPDERNALIYAGEPFVCDLCHEGDDLDLPQPECEDP